MANGGWQAINNAGHNTGNHISQRRSDAAINHGSHLNTHSLTKPNPGESAVDQKVGTPVDFRYVGAELVKAARDPAYRTAMNNIGVEATSSSPEAFASFVRAEMNKWARVVQITDTKVD